MLIYISLLMEKLCVLIYFIGEGMGKLSLADRATIANMSPEYGATMGFFPVDHVTLDYLKLTGRSDDTVGSTLSSLSFFLLQIHPQILIVRIMEFLYLT